MKSTNQDQVKAAFTQQASGFESDRMNFTKKGYLDYVVERVAAKPDDAVLEVAAGTCACGRAIAPHAGSVICLDMTPAMLSIGKAEAEKAGLNNMTFVLGDAAELPFLDESFDIVFVRLAFHHFPETKAPFAEMVRVLRPGGKLVFIDMEAPEAELREKRDAIEKMRDASHVRNLSTDEMLALFCENGLSVSLCEAVKMPIDLQTWLDHTETPAEVQAQVKVLMDDEIRGGAKTGFAPYVADGEVCFAQQWVLVIGEKDTGR